MLRFKLATERKHFQIPQNEEEFWKFSQMKQGVSKEDVNKFKIILGLYTPLYEWRGRYYHKHFGPQYQRYLEKNGKVIDNDGKSVCSKKDVFNWGLGVFCGPYNASSE